MMKSKNRIIIQSKKITKINTKDSSILDYKVKIIKMNLNNNNNSPSSSSSSNKATIINKISIYLGAVMIYINHHILQQLYFI